jgi:hypothetical protein
MNGPDDRDDDLPEPEIETVRNFSDLPEELRDAITHGALLALGGLGVRDNAVDVRVMSKVLEHFDRLVRIVRADRSGFEVKRLGRIVEVKGAKRLTALPAWAGSYAMPLRLEAPEGELDIVDHHELEAVVELLALDEQATQSRLDDLPERVGDELLGLLRAIASGHVDLHVEAVRDNQPVASADIESGVADRRSTWLEDKTWSEPGVDTLVGTLFRIDTKRARIAVDVSEEDGESTLVEEASFPLDLLEELRGALHSRVEIQVNVLEERRRYERTARGRSMTVTAVRQIPDS